MLRPDRPRLRHPQVSLVTSTGTEVQEGGWRVLVYFTIGLATVLVATTSLGLFLPDIIDDLDLSPAEQGWLGSSLLLANVVFSIPMNWWVSRFRPWKTAAVGFVAASGLIALAGGAPGFGMLIFARIGLGIVLQACQSPRNILILQWIPKRRYGLANGFSISIVDILMGTGTVLIPYMLGWFGGWRETMFVWAGVVMAAAMLWMAMGKDRGRPEAREAGDDTANGSPLRSIMKYREIWFICLGMFGMLLARLAFSSFWPRYMGEEYLIDVRTTGILMGIGTFAMAPAELGVVAIPFFARHTTLVLLACGVGQALTYIGLIATDSFPLLILLWIVGGVMFSFFPILMTQIFNLPGITQREVAVASATVFAALWGGGAVGPILVGFVEEATSDLRFGLFISSFAPLMLVITALLLAVYRRETPELTKADRIARRAGSVPD